ncbi:hypothetical protein GGU10DRAFT_338461 [Lentinula aff. detonsa]|uniref:FK506-binding protein n=1 Tax=Lentinula aff. detonsa TaxID=2804958 RepID=A0AA38U163_9AGAR|nr:hypothetical protein GGU10DRAFT_338461 [Lentinula aff. detonsa]
MSIAIAPWGVELEGGKTVEIRPPSDLKITNVALGDVLADANERTTFKLGIPLLSESEDDEDDEDDEGNEEEDKMQTLTICSLTAGKIEQANVEIIILQDQLHKFQIVGKNTICLTGYYIDQNFDESPDLSGFSDDEDEDVHDLRYVSSDVEMPLDELDEDSDAGRFEEVDQDEDEQEVTTGSKRGRDSLASNDATKPLSKAEKKKNKKQKLQDGTAAAPGVTSEKVAEKKTEGKKEEEKKKKTDSQKGESKNDKEDKTKLKEKELPSGLKIKDAKIGTGPMAKKGQMISMRYIGKLPNGKVFDSNTKGKPFVFRLGAGEVIKGWDEGIAGIQAGGERILTVPAALGYGKRGSPPQIPGNATLIFEVKCVSIK